jgi:hypothetical protein
MNLASELRAIEPQVRTSPWPGHELVRGYGVMVLPFSSSHLLGLRVWPQNDFAPYASVWHRTPDGDWEIYSDGPLIEATCPRYWGPALERGALAQIELAWTGPNRLRVEMERPRLTWTMAITASPLVRVLNAASAALPLWTWKPAPLLRLREWMANRLFDEGDLRFSFVTPSGHDTTIMPEQMLFIKASEAVWDGQDLGTPVRLDANPTIGGIPLPKRPTFVIGQAHMRTPDREEYKRTRQQARAGALEHELNALVHGHQTDAA